MQALLTARLTAERLGVSRQTVRNMARDGRLKPIGRVAGDLGPYLFDPAEVDALAAAQREGVER